MLNNRDGYSTSTYTYDRYGNLARVGIVGGTRPRTITYFSETNGQIISRAESDNVYNQADPWEKHYYFGGVTLGQVGNDGTGNVDYAQSVAAAF